MEEIETNKEKTEATEREKQIYGSDVGIIHRDNEATIYRLADEQGEVIITSYEVFPGIELLYNNVHTSCYATNITGEEMHILEIEHCREGRVECEMNDGYFYLTPGDISVHPRVKDGHKTFFPSNHYHGITMIIDLKRAPQCLSYFLEDVDVQPIKLASRFCSTSDLFVLRKTQGLDHIFAELYSVPIGIRKGYFKIKILEILLMLSEVSLSDAQHTQKFSASQVVLAKNVEKYLSDNMSKHITIAQLAEQFLVSETRLKDSFKGVYGMPIYQYTRTQKMKSAAHMLLTSNVNIIDIAGLHGYDNGSKFAKAFSCVMGMSPNAYRCNDGK